jgi:membrane protease YdiL (CAAX protease family)
MIPGFLFGVLCGAVIFTWIYNGTGGSILMVAIWHALFDMLSASKAGQDIVPTIMTALIIVGALYLGNTAKPWNFRFAKPHIPHSAPDPGGNREYQVSLSHEW